MARPDLGARVSYGALAPVSIPAAGRCMGGRYAGLRNALTDRQRPWRHMLVHAKLVEPPHVGTGADPCGRRLVLRHHPDKWLFRICDSRIPKRRVVVGPCLQQHAIPAPEWRVRRRSAIGRSGGVYKGRTHLFLFWDLTGPDSHPFFAF